MNETSEGTKTRWLGPVSTGVALFLSVVSIVYNVLGYFQKPSLHLLPPEQITLYAVKGANGPRVAMVTDFTIFNDSRPDKYGVVTGEFLEFTVNGQRRTLRWQQFGMWDDLGFKQQLPAQPFSVGGGNVSVQEVSFHPRSKDAKDLKPRESVGDNWVSWSDFLRELHRGNLSVRCVAELYDGGSTGTNMEVQVTPGVLEALEDEDRMWAAAACRHRP